MESDFLLEKGLLSGVIDRRWLIVLASSAAVKVTFSPLSSGHPSLLDGLELGVKNFESYATEPSAQYWDVHYKGQRPRELRVTEHGHLLTDPKEHGDRKYLAIWVRGAKEDAPDGVETVKSVSVAKSEMLYGRLLVASGVEARKPAGRHLVIGAPTTGKSTFIRESKESWADTDNLFPLVLRPDAAPGVMMEGAAEKAALRYATIAALITCGNNNVVTNVWEVVADPVVRSSFETITWYVRDAKALHDAFIARDAKRVADGKKAIGGMNPELAERWAGSDVLARSEEVAKRFGVKFIRLRADEYIGQKHSAVAQSQVGSGLDKSAPQRPEKPEPDVSVENKGNLSPGRRAPVVLLSGLNGPLLAALKTSLERDSWSVISVPLPRYEGERLGYTHVPGGGPDVLIVDGHGEPGSLVGEAWLSGELGQPSNITALATVGPKEWAADAAKAAGVSNSFSTTAEVAAWVTDSFPSARDALLFGSTRRSTPATQVGTEFNANLPSRFLVFLDKAGLGVVDSAEDMVSHALKAKASNGFSTMKFSSAEALESYGPVLRGRAAAVIADGERTDEEKDFAKVARGLGLDVVSSEEEGRKPDAFSVRAGVAAVLTGPARSNYDGLNAHFLAVTRDSPFMCLPGIMANDSRFLAFQRALQDSQGEWPKASGSPEEGFRAPGLTTDALNITAVSGMSHNPRGVVPADNVSAAVQMVDAMRKGGDESRANKIEKMKFGSKLPPEVIEVAKAVCEVLVPEKAFGSFNAKMHASFGGHISQTSVSAKRETIAKFLSQAPGSRLSMLWAEAKGKNNSDAIISLETEFFMSFFFTVGYRFQGDKATRRPDGTLLGKPRLVQDYTGKWLNADKALAIPVSEKGQKGGTADPSSFTRSRSRPVAASGFGAGLPLRSVATGLVQLWKQLFPGLKLQDATRLNDVVAAYSSCFSWDNYQHDRFAWGEILEAFNSRAGEVYGVEVAELASTMLHMAILAKNDYIGGSDWKWWGDPRSLQPHNNPGNPSGHPWTYLYATVLTLVYWAWHILGRVGPDRDKWKSDFRQLISLTGNLGIIVTGDNGCCVARGPALPQWRALKKDVVDMKFDLCIPELTGSFAGAFLFESGGSVRAIQALDNLIDKTVNPMRSLLSLHAGKWHRGYLDRVNLYSGLPGGPKVVSILDECAKQTVGKELTVWAQQRQLSDEGQLTTEITDAMLLEILNDPDKLLWKYGMEELPEWFVRQWVSLNFLSISREEGEKITNSIIK